MSATYLALGDSYTIGEGVPRDEIWPAQLVRRLEDAGIATEPPRVIARTGWTTDELLAALQQEAIEPNYDLVTLLIGVNDQYRGRSEASFLEGLRALMMRALQYAGGRPERVLMVSIPDWGVTAFGEGRDRSRIAEEIDAFNAAKKAEAEEHGFAWVDVTAASRQAGDEAAMLASDGLHPSGAQYGAWVEGILPAAQAILTSGR